LDESKFLDAYKIVLGYSLYPGYILGDFNLFPYIICPARHLQIIECCTLINVLCSNKKYKILKKILIHIKHVSTDVCYCVNSKTGKITPESVENLEAIYSNFPFFEHMSNSINELRKDENARKIIDDVFEIHTNKSLVFASDGSKLIIRKD